MKWIMMNEWFETKYIPPKQGKIKQTHILLSCFYQITNTSVKNESMAWSALFFVISNSDKTI